jgi:membrane protease YdiL (CAAX protease family)
MTTPPNPLFDGEVPPDPLSQPVPPAPVEYPPWSLGDVLLLAAFAFSAVFILQFVAIAIGSHFYPHKTLLDLARNPKLLVPPQLAAYGLVLIFMVSMLRSRGLRFWYSIRWQWPSAWPVFFLLGLALSIVVQLMSAALPIPKQLPVEEFFSTTFGTYMLALFGITIAPLIEELLFRGFLYPALARRIGIAASVVITSLLFALIHAPQLAHSWAPLVLIFTVGIVLTLIRVRTGSVASSFLVHVGYNFSLFAVMFFATDHFRHLERMR